MKRRGYMHLKRNKGVSENILQQISKGTKEVSQGDSERQMTVSAEVGG